MSLLSPAVARSRRRFHKEIFEHELAVASVERRVAIDAHDLRLIRCERRLLPDDVILGAARRAVEACFLGFGHRIQCISIL